MRDLLDRLVEIGPVDVERLRVEPLTALAVERVLTLLVDLAFATNSHVAAARLGRAPESYAASFDAAVEAGLLDADLAAALRPSAGLRNVLVHAYVDVDPSAVARAVPLAVEHYGTYVRRVAALLEQESQR
jgi:uncharacterized protein YutE (UPF0331/DUF86 family)